jgi:hypothetical protein
MWKPVLAVALAAAVLAAVDRALTSSETSARVNTKKVGRLVPFAERGGGVKPVGTIPAALEVEYGKGTVVQYGLTAGVWRCFTYRNAPAAEDRVKGVVNKILEAEGIVETRESKRAAEFGLDTPATITLRLYWTPEDMARKAPPAAVVDVGRAVEGDAGSYMRKHGELDIWAVDANPLPELVRVPNSPLPALLDPSIVPMYWLQASKQVKAIKIERTGAPAVDLEMREKQISPEEVRQGKFPFDWISKSASGEKVCDSKLAMGFTGFLMRAPYADIVDPTRIPQLGFENSQARVTLVPREGAPLELYVKASAVAGRSLVYNAACQAAFEVPSDFANLLLPSEEQLVNPASPNPWSQILQQQR